MHYWRSLLALLHDGFMAMSAPSSMSYCGHLFKSLMPSMRIHQIHPFLSILLLVLTLSSFSFIFFSFYRKMRDSEKSSSYILSLLRISFSGTRGKLSDSETRPLFVEILTSNLPPPKWALPDAASSFCHSQASLGSDAINDSAVNCSDPTGSEVDMDYCGENYVRSFESKGKKKKRRGKKKRQSSQEDVVGREDEGMGADSRFGVAKHGEGCFYPFTSPASVTQRKIKQHYDQLVKANDDKALTMTQVGQFANCLIDARNELQHKSEIIQRKFTITKALLFKADRSSFERLCQQIYKLEAEQKRLEEDAAVYNRLQEQLKLSPAYKQMLEIAVRMELQEKSGEPAENPDTDYAYISFEELLAQEKRDSFWQRNGKLRSVTN